MTAEEYAKEFIDGWMLKNYPGIRESLTLTIKEAMRDQRYACAKAIVAIPETEDDACGEGQINAVRAHQAVMNAKVTKGKGGK